jgi:hypothetical protein
MGAGTAVDGRTVTQEVLEKKIDETMACCPLPFRKFHATVNGRQNAMELITEMVSRRKR